MATVTFNNLVNADAMVNNAATIINGAGANVTSSTTGAYFANAFAVNDAYTITRQTPFRNVRFNVGTAMAAAAVTFAWEYNKAGTWTALAVDNPNALTKTGVQVVSFTPPGDWTPPTNGDFQVRCRISAVTTPTAGGAQITNKVQLGNNAVQLTGTTGDTNAHGCSVADLAGTYDLISTQAVAASYTPVEMPVNQIDGASSKVDVVTASGTYAAASVTLTGTDYAGNSQNETIAFTVDATKTSVLAYKNITSITTTGISGGSATLRVYQKRWGVVQEHQNSDTYDLLYDWHCFLHVGDGSTTTTFDSSNEFWRFRNGTHPMVRTGATWTSGSQYTGTNINRGKAGHAIEIYWYYQQLSQGGSNPTIIVGGTTTWYGCKLTFYGYPFGQALGIVLSGTPMMTDCVFEIPNGSTPLLGVYGGTATWTRVRTVGGQIEFITVSGITFTNCEMDSTIRAINIDSFTMSGTPVDFVTVQTLNSSILFTFNDSGVTSANFSFGQFGATDPEFVDIFNTEAVHVQTPGGTPINAARLRIIDTALTLVSSLSTNASGDASALVKYQKLAGTNGSTTITTTTYSPHTIKLLEYAYNFVSLVKTLSAPNSGGTAKDTFLAVTDPYVVAAEATANAYTGIAINWAAGTITISSAHTYQELYDYCKAQNILNPTYDQPFTTTDGVNYKTNFDIILTAALTGAGKGLNLNGHVIRYNAGGSCSMKLTNGTLRLTAAGTYSETYDGITVDFIATGTYDLRSATVTNTLTFTDSVTSTVTVQIQPGVSNSNSDPTHITVQQSTAVVIKVQGMVTGSQVRVTRVDDGTELLNAAETAGAAQTNFTFTTNFDVNVSVRNSSGAGTRYLEWLGTGTVTAAGITVTASQVADPNNLSTIIATPTGWSINWGTGVITAAAAQILTASQLYAWLMSLADNSGNMQYAIPMTAQVLGANYTLGVGYTLAANTEQFLKTGGIQTSDGNNVYTNVYTVGSIAGTPNIYIEQNGAKITSWWSTGHIDVLVKTKNAGSLIDSGNLYFFIRKFNYSYEYVAVDASGGGRQVVALSTLTDTDNPTASATVAGYSDITLTWGTASKDIGDGTGAHNYDVVIDGAGRSVSQIYEYLKYLTRDGATALLPPTTGVQGQLYLTAQPTYPVIKNGPFASFAGGKIFGAQGVYLQNVAAADALNYQVIDAAGATHRAPSFIAVSGFLTGSRVYLYNTGGAGSPTWLASTAYTVGKGVLRPSGIGAESGGGGLWYECTTAGTSGGSQPSWNTAVGGTTADGSVVWTTRSVIINNSIVAGTSILVNYIHTGTADANRTITLKVAYQATTAAKQFITQTGTASSTGLSFSVTQSDDVVYNNNAVDGSTLTEFSVSGTTIKILVNQAGGADTLPKMYNWWVYLLSTATGIRDQNAANFTAVDTAHYTFAGGQQIKNVTSPGVPLMLTGGVVRDGSGSVPNTIDTTGYNIYLVAANVEPYGLGTSNALTLGQFVALK